MYSMSVCVGVCVHVLACVHLQLSDCASAPGFKRSTVPYGPCVLAAACCASVHAKPAGLRRVHKVSRAALQPILPQ